MDYVCHRRFKFIDLDSKPINIPALTLCHAYCDTIYYNGQRACITTSENAHQFFARDDDNQGIRRGKLTQAIQSTLKARDENYQVRWDKIQSDPLLQKYSRKEHPDFWVWNHDFFNAPIWDLEYIASLIDAKIKED